MSYRWDFFPDQTRLQEQIARTSSISSLAARLLVNRGITSTDEADTFLRPSLSSLTDPFQMSHMERAVDRLLFALRNKQQIVVYGDSDVDGVCGTALLAGFLGLAGARVSTYIPNRLEEGYSLTEKGVAEILRRQASVVVTVDNGTTANQRITELVEQGVDVIVADHHETSEEIPPALALLNPKWSECGYGFRYLCGTGVAFQLLAGLATRLPARGAAADAMSELLGHCVGLVAMATICDCVPLVGENRTLARAGLSALRLTEHPGIKALLRISSVPKEVQADDVSFRLGPRINAAGRLGYADRALSLMLCRDRDQARKLAGRLDELNGERQELEAVIHKSARIKARAAVERGDPILVLGDPAWHSGVVGIVATRLANEFNRPAVLAAFVGERGRGSGRAIPGFDLRAALAGASEHLIGFGGHAAAAGFEVETARFDAFRDKLIEVAGGARTEEDERSLMIDAELPLGALTPSTMADINRLSPFGQGLAQPVFAAPDLRLASDPRLVGKNRNHLTFMVQQAGVTRKAIAFGQGERADDLHAEVPFSMAFTPRLNLFRGQAAVELDVKDIRAGKEVG